MMMKKGLTAAVVALLIAMNVQAEEQRTRLTKENKFPELGQVELGVGVTFLEFGDDNESSRLGDANLTRLAAEVRFGLLPNLTVSLLVPFDSFEPDVGDDDSSLGDVEIGLQLKAFEDIFDYPYVIPYVTYDFGNGEPYLLPEGYGDDTFTIGVSVGTVTYDLWTWGIDLSYDINGESENSAVLGGSLFYEVGPQFSIGVEANIRENQTAIDALGVEDETTPVLIMGTMVYQATDDLEFAISGGNGTDRQLDTFANFKTTFTF